VAVARGKQSGHLYGANALHVILVLKLWNDPVREFLYYAGDISGEADGDGICARESRCIPVELRERKNLGAYAVRRRVSKVLKNLDRIWDSQSGIGSEKGNVAASEDEVVPAAQFDNGPTNRRFGSESEEANSAPLQSKEIVRWHFSEGFEKPLSFVVPKPGCLMDYDASGKNIEVPLVEIEDLREECAGGSLT
jgi:hypothetical protein